MMARLKQNDPLEIVCEYQHKALKDVPCSFLLKIYTLWPDLPKNLVKWIEINMEDLELATNAGDEATLNSYFDLKK